MKCFDVKTNAGDIQHKKSVIKCSPEIRPYIMNRSGGYIFVGLCWCKVYDRYFVPQRFHCYGFNHFANNCPNRNNPARCGKRSRQHNAENCRSKFFKCLSCLKAKVNGS